MLHMLACHNCNFNFSTFEKYVVSICLLLIFEMLHFTLLFADCVLLRLVFDHVICFC
jgi:hypothetical protein